MSDLTTAPDEIPKWLTIDFFRKHLSVSADAKIKSVEHACAKGDNFASKIFRVGLQFEDGSTKSLIVKSRPIGNSVSEEFVKKFNVFPKEIEMYDFVSRFEEIYRATGCDVSFSPR
jgi:hypothetical protein